MTPLQRLRIVFKEIGVPFVEEKDEEGWTTLYCCSDQEQEKGELSKYSTHVYFEFNKDEDLASSP